MKNLIYLLLLFVLMQAKSSDLNGALVEFRLSYFYPTSSDLRKIYHDGGIDYQLTSSIPILNCGMNLWLAADYFSRDGHSIGQNFKTSIRIVPITFGLKYYLPSHWFNFSIQPYLAGGGKYYFLHIHNHSDVVNKKINKDGLGGVLEAGFIKTFRNCYVIDLFAAYSFKTFGAPSTSNPAVETTGFNVGGLNVGGGIGYKF